MKVIGKSEQDKYICEISHSELGKFLNQYYNNMGRLKTVDFVNLANKRVINSIITGIETMGALEKK